MAAVAAIVLAAGSAQRFGANKLLARFRGKPLLRHAVEACCASHAAGVYVVTGPSADLVKDTLADLPVIFVANPNFTRGLSSSLQAGLLALPPTIDGALVALADMPLVSSETLNRLIAGFAPQAGRMIGVPISNGEQGNPVLWGRTFFPEILALSGDRGAKALLAQHSDSIYRLEVDGADVHIDIDTPEDLARYE